MKTTFQSERLGITIAEHGEQVWNNTKNLIVGNFENFKLPEWFVQNHHFIVNNLYDWETIEMYTLYHDIGKVFCRTVDEDGKVHFPEHDKISKEKFSEFFPAFPDAAELIGLDMFLHKGNPTKVLEANLSIRILCTLLIVSFAEIHANAKMFAISEGTEDFLASTSFKIKYKNLDRIGKKVVESICKSNDYYMYVFVRQDLVSKSHILVQAGHAIFEQAKDRDKHPSFVALEGKDEIYLKKIMAYLLECGIQFKIFREPMVPYNGEITAISTEPLSGERRKYLKQFKLLNL